MIEAIEAAGIALAAAEQARLNGAGVGGQIKAFLASYTPAAQRGMAPHSKAVRDAAHDVKQVWQQR